MKKFPIILNVALAVCLCPSLNLMLYAQSNMDRTYHFKVFLEDEEIGQQHFVVSSHQTGTTVEINAQFEVKYWFLTAYSYRHINKELWNGECLQMIRSQTNDNGTTFFVQGTSVDNRMKLITKSGIRTVDGCIKTFAYWDASFLSSQSLLNSQTGEMNRVTVHTVGEEMIKAKNRLTPATRYQIVAETFSIDLWYSPKGDWLALESTTEEESRLRYELQ